MKVQVLGSGCDKCHQVEDNTREALDQVDREVEVETIYDLTEASAMGMMEAPGLAIDGELKLQGRVPGVDEIVESIESA